MRKTTKRLFALLLTLAMVIGLLPTLAFAGNTLDGGSKASTARKADGEIQAIPTGASDELWEAITKLEDEKILNVRGKKASSEDYAKLVDQIIDMVEASDSFREGSIERHGDFFYWVTTDGQVNGYSPRLRAQVRATGDPEADPEAYAGTETMSFAPKGGGPTSTNVAVFQPYYGIDSSFQTTYANEGVSIAQAVGGTSTTYLTTDATITNIGAALDSCGVVIFDSHGDTDYASGSDYTSRANTSYLCLQSNTGLTTADQAQATGDYGTYYHAYYAGANGSMRYYCVDGTAISNHMTGGAPNSLLWMAICLGMATKGMHEPIRAKGVEVCYGYSQSVTFTGDYAWEELFWNEMKDGEEVANAIAYMKQQVGCPDPYVSSRPAYPIVVSSEDSYPGHGNVDAAQSVYSSWSLFGTNFTVTARSNNEAWGTVTVQGSNITATPAEGYYTAGYEILSGTAAVTQSGNSFLVHAESDCTVQINFAPKTATTVTYMAGSTAVGTVSTYLGDEVTLPTSSAEFVDWSFIGWMDRPVSTTMEKPDFYKPGASYTVNTDNPVLYALYKHIDGDGSVAYELVQPTRGAMDGVYVISSGTTNAMYVMTGVSGSVNIESGSQGFTAFANTGIELEDNALRNVGDAYRFTVEEQSDGYSVRSVSTGSYLAVYSSYLWTRASYESAYCNWTLTPTSSGVTMKCTADTSYPYLSWNGSKWAAASASSLVQLWKEAPSGDVYYSTAPVVEEHEHEMAYTAAAAPTCSADGHIEYWQCSVCFKYFSDAAGENEITQASTVLAALGHDYLASSPLPPPPSRAIPPIPAPAAATAMWATTWPLSAWTTPWYSPSPWSASSPTTWSATPIPASPCPPSRPPRAISSWAGSRILTTMWRPARRPS